ncbi:hypothetical protein F4560_001794 [Saccharothrix ecbatanensis]|uniref:Uncharacterized protein n=1 Tax=Saccharothrix ecbatanensis TaxID=1105145 RepID=A0A7W9HHI1_9PSEU|nr:hypothetical protein [Saccharothrix ecbatanensis]MBB5802026.1 hypothetical protein [Saccharothrix ecbatanensis]
MTNPFTTAEGEQAQRNLFRALAAADDGAMADFAKEVVAGRRSPRDLLTQGWAVESVMDETLAAVDKFHRLPEAEREVLVEEGPAFLEEYVAGLAGMDVEPTPPPARPVRDDDDDDQGPSLLRDAW